MAFETEISNFITIGNAVSAGISGAFVNASQGLGLVYAESLPANTNVKKFRKSGSLTAEAISESAAYTYSANSELTHTSVTATATKKMVATRMSVESLRFASDVGAEMSRIAAAQGAALARLFDADLKALFSGISGIVTASTILTKDNLLDAQYTIFNGIKGAFSGKLVGMLDYKGANEMRKELTSATASIFGNMETLGLVGNPKSPAGYIGNFAGIDLYQTDGLPSGGGDDTACIWDPAICFAAAIDGVSGFNTTIQEPAVSNNMGRELVTYGFWNIVEWNDAAACAVKSDT